jgi:hypothetical protein
LAISSSDSEKFPLTTTRAPRGKIIYGRVLRDESEESLMQASHPSVATNLGDSSSPVGEKTSSEVSVITNLTTNRNTDKHCLLGTCGGKKITGANYARHMRKAH